MRYLNYLFLVGFLLLTTQCSEDADLYSIEQDLRQEQLYDHSKSLKNRSKGKKNEKWQQDFATIKDEILSRNKNKKFLDRLVRSVGHPNWDWAFSATPLGEGFPYIVPFLKHNDTRSNAVLMVTRHKNGKKLEFNLVEREPFVNLISDGKSKKINENHWFYANIFMYYDNRIYEHLDQELINWINKNRSRFTQKSSKILKSCDRYEVCYLLPDQPEIGGCPADPVVVGTCDVWVCTVYYDCGDGGIGGDISGGGSYGGSGGGGSGSGGGTCYTCEIDANYPQDSDPSTVYANLNEGEYYALLVEGFIIAEVELINQLRRIFDDALIGLQDAWPKNQEEWDELIDILIDEFTDIDVLVEFVPFVGDFISAARNFNERRYWSAGLDLAAASTDVFGGRFAKASLAIGQVTNRSFRILNKIINLRKINVSFINKMPKHWKREISDDGRGVIWRNPNNPKYDHIRVSEGIPSSPYPNSRNPYVRRFKNGQYVDKYGNRVDLNDPNGHIPWDEYIDFNFN